METLVSREHRDLLGQLGHWDLVGNKGHKGRAEMMVPPASQVRMEPQGSKVFRESLDFLALTELQGHLGLQEIPVSRANEDKMVNPELRGHRGQQVSLAPTVSKDLQEPLEPLGKMAMWDR